ncbi:glycosyltransferase family 4 protein [Curtobacterium sp. MCBD17_008]|uniref:glycosyltransferase family 4 protein n=1 Tax=Curtobacterium sp. MCBD17_008 TaxID=2175656 RepID=UPI000DA79D76|nr:glycosyltransferase family 4 protein [Curtobacterium sp. MCBD17_008]PZE90455.1 glycosyl transferase group 1 [Curtobacterium sp. MCBD17_008]
MTVQADGRDAEMNIVFAQGRDVPSWEQRHAAGLIPDRWPYGLDGVTRHFGGARAVEVGPLRPLPLLGALLSGRQRQRDARRTTISMSWEEDVALRMLEQYPADIALSGVIWATDTPDSMAARVKQRLSRRALRQMSLVWTLSKPQVEIVERWLGAGGPPVRYLRFGVDHEFFTEKPFPSTPMLFSAGGDRDRDPATLFRAIEIVRRERPTIEVMVQSRTQLQPPDGVTVVPYLTHQQLREAYERASVVAIATRPNVHASGMTVSLEAMAVGRPVVITETPGLDDYVQDGGTGFLVPCSDGRALASKVLALLEDQAEARAMGRRARERVVASFTSAQMADELAGFATSVSGDAGISRSS